MANLIQIKRSLTTSSPPSLANGELAYTANGDVLFIGSNGAVVPIAGKRTPGTLTANQALVANSTGYLDYVKTANAWITTLNANGSIGTAGQVLVSNGSIVYWGTGTTGSNTQIQFNDSGVANASAGFTFDKSTNNLFVANSTNTTTLFANVSGTYANLSGQVNTGTLYVNTSANVGTYFTVNSSSANISVNTSFGGSLLTLGANVVFNANVTTNGALTTHGGTNTYFTSNTTVAGTNTVISSNTFLNANVTTTGALITLGGTNTYITSNSTISGTSTTINANTTIQGSVLNISANSTVNGSLTVINSNLTVNSTSLTINSNTNFSGRIASNFLPTVNNSYDIGSSTYYWRNGWFGTSVQIGNSNISDANGTITTNNINIGTNLTVNNIIGTTTNISSNVNFTGSHIYANSASLSVSTANVAGNLYVGQDLIISGNLTSTNVSTLSVTDPIIFLALENITDIVDIGLIAHYDATNKHTGFIRHAATDQWYLFKNWPYDPVTPVIDVANTNFHLSELNTYLISAGLVSNATNVTITANSSLAVGLTANTISLSTPLPGTSGGTGINTYTNQDILVANATNGFSKLGIGATGTVLQSNGTSLVYATLDGGSF